MYRTPEIMDLYSNFPICEKQDIWVRWRLAFFLAWQADHVRACLPCSSSSSFSRASEAFSHRRELAPAASGLYEAVP